MSDSHMLYLSLWAIIFLLLVNLFFIIYHLRKTRELAKNMIDLSPEELCLRLPELTGKIDTLLNETRSLKEKKALFEEELERKLKELTPNPNLQATPVAAPKREEKTPPLETADLDLICQSIDEITSRLVKKYFTEVADAYLGKEENQEPSTDISRIARYQRGLADAIKKLVSFQVYLRSSGKKATLAALQINDSLKLGDLMESCESAEKKLLKLLEPRGDNLDSLKQIPVKEILPSFKKFFPQQITAQTAFDLHQYLKDYIQAVNREVNETIETEKIDLANHPQESFVEWREKLFLVLDELLKAFAWLESEQVENLINSIKDMATLQVAADWKMLCRKLQEKINNYLNLQGIKEMEIKEGETPFNPNLQIKAGEVIDLHLPDRTVVQLRKIGYLSPQGELIRKAEVLVSKKE